MAEADFLQAVVGNIRFPHREIDRFADADRWREGEAHFMALLVDGAERAIAVAGMSAAGLRLNAAPGRMAGGMKLGEPGLTLWS